MDVIVHCSCGQRLRCPEESGRKGGRCPSCNAWIAVPGRREETPPPLREFILTEEGKPDALPPSRSPVPQVSRPRPRPLPWILAAGAAVLILAGGLVALLALVVFRNEESSSAPASASGTTYAFAPFPKPIEGLVERVSVRQESSEKSRAVGKPDSEENRRQNYQLLRTVLKCTDRTVTEERLLLESAELVVNGKLQPCDIVGKLIVATHEGDSVRYRHEGGQSLSAADLAFLQGLLGDMSFEMKSEILPKQAVRVGETWSIDAETLAQAFAKGAEGAKLDSIENRFSLRSVEHRDGVDFGVIEGLMSMRIAVSGQESQDMRMEWNMSSRYDLCLDGTSRSRETSVQMDVHFRASPRLPSEDPATEGEVTLKMEVNVTQVSPKTLPKSDTPGPKRAADDPPPGKRAEGPPASLEEAVSSPERLPQVPEIAFQDFVSDPQKFKGKLVRLKNVCWSGYGGKTADVARVQTLGGSTEAWLRVHPLAQGNHARFLRCLEYGSVTLVLEGTGEQEPSKTIGTLLAVQLEGAIGFRVIYPTQAELDPDAIARKKSFVPSPARKTEAPLPASTEEILSSRERLTQVPDVPAEDFVSDPERFRGKVMRLRKVRWAEYMRPSVSEGLNRSWSTARVTTQGGSVGMRLRIHPIGDEKEAAFLDRLKRDNVCVVLEGHGEASDELLGTILALQLVGASEFKVLHPTKAEIEGDFRFRKADDLTRLFQSTGWDGFGLDSWAEMEIRRGSAEPRRIRYRLQNDYRGEKTLDFRPGDLRDLEIPRPGQLLPVLRCPRVRVTAWGWEELPIAGRNLRCGWMEGRSDSMGVMKLWASDEVPGRVVRWIRTEEGTTIEGKCVGYERK